MIRRLLRAWARRYDDRQSLRCGIVLGRLASGPASGRELREALARGRLGMGGPAFYGLMAVLERDGAVRGRDETREVDGVEVGTRIYSR